MKPVIVIKRLGAVLSALLLLGASTLLPSRLEAQCAQWDVSGEWEIIQGPTTIFLSLTQNGTNVTGTARYEALSKHGMFDSTYPAKGSVNATISGDKFNGEISWSNNNTVGVYSGFVSANGFLRGRMYDKARQSNSLDWSRNGAMKCVTPVSAMPEARTVKRPQATPAQREIVVTGKPRVPANVPTATLPPSQTAGAPSISASPQSVALPSGLDLGTTTITWDGGADHPYAELWVRVDGANEKFVVEQGKGSRRVTVQRGKTYLYILSDSGQRLATVTVKAK